VERQRREQGKSVSGPMDTNDREKMQDEIRRVRTSLARPQLAGATMIADAATQ